LRATQHQVDASGSFDDALDFERIRRRRHPSFTVEVDRYRESPRRLASIREVRADGYGTEAAAL